LTAAQHAKQYTSEHTKNQLQPKKNQNTLKWWWT